MGYKMKGFSGFGNSPAKKKIWPPVENVDVDKEIKKDEEEHPGYGNPKTPGSLYREDGTRVSTANIDEGELSADKTDSKGRYTLYAPEGEKSIKYYYKKP